MIESIMKDDDVDQMLKYVYSDNSLYFHLMNAEYALADSVFYYRTLDSLHLYDDMKPMLIGLIIGLEYHRQYLNDHGIYEG